MFLKVVGIASPIKQVGTAYIGSAFFPRAKMFHHKLPVVIFWEEHFESNFTNGAGKHIGGVDLYAYFPQLYSN
ncbi:MAG: hypothetical protein LBS60_10665 [Deltaproteobacteria bacterium]|jgi:hypothetical protein|nr:hypothetical protein [Deltaproteobacteria bacterium]